ncbi:hypothetical protein [Shewanella cyperi]|uniref:hypothetical protein n=1 Tax=Shewanella cyperi TaxID=2814292 RepID=UPI001A940FCB|nr:hypothetical protein [Shewanella cyperi]QSX40341.1 hypothetical protein JYB84_15460 [Shewanella cyperi]
MRLAVKALVICGCFLVHGLQQAQAEEIGQWHEIHFNSNPAVNFHHFLFEMARTGEDLKTQGWKRDLSKDELDRLSSIVAYYKEHLITRGRSAMRTDPESLAISRELTQYTPGRTLRFENPDYQALFEKSFPIYADLLWQRDDASNKLWLSNLLPLLEKYGNSIQARVEAKLEHPLFSAKQHKVDIVYRPGHKNGAFTLEIPYTAINSFRSDYSGLASLEMIFHEVSHSSATDTLFDKVMATFKQEGVENSTAIWHPIMFYTVGTIVEQTLAQDHIQYIQYGSKQGIFTEGYFSSSTPYIEKYWAPHMDNNERMDATIASIAKEMHLAADKTAKTTEQN